MAAAAQKRRKTASVNGLLLLNKPAGLTSNQALQKVKRMLNAAKAGHTGSLDPAATGMLPLCFGEATKVCAYLLDADKRYRVVAKLGEATDTADADGVVTGTAEVPALTARDWERVLRSFVGEIEQVPPMYSALKQGGKRLYELARQGQVVDRAARKVRIHEISLLEASGSRLAFRVHCSKGTYIRTLVEDVARAAGTVAHTAALHRETVAAFKAADMLDLDEAAALANAGPAALLARLIPADSALGDWPQCQLPPGDAERFCGGQLVDEPGGASQAAGLQLRVYNDAGGFLGVGQATGDGRVAPRRIFRLASD
ncbi:MAG: tRNA pseudouridine(55) synthase TruB [Woeseia sp.]